MIGYHLYAESKKIQQTSGYSQRAADSQIKRTKQELPAGRGMRGTLGVEVWEYKLLDIRQAQGCIEQHGEYNQYCVITINGK